jgi:hypothetical protein
MDRPTVTVACVADRGHAAGERVIEITFPDGKGCLVSLQSGGDKHTLEIYRADAGICVVTKAGEVEL